MKKRMLAVLIVTLIALSTILTSCGKSGGNSSESTTAESTSPKEKQLLKLEIANYGVQPNQATSSEYVKKAYDGKLKTDIQFTLSANYEEYKNKMSLRIASSDYPDLIRVDKDMLIKYAKQNQLLELNNYFDKLNTTLVYIGQDNLKKTSYNSKVYGLPLKEMYIQNSMWIRKDWMDKLGLKLPKTLDEYLEVAKAFTEKDPDGNGKKDTYGISATSMMTEVFPAFGVPSPTLSISVKDNKATNNLYEQGTKDALAYVKKLVDAGVVDPDMMINKGIDKTQQKAIQGKVGMLFNTWPLMVKDENIKLFKDVNPNAEWIQFEGPKGPAGQIGITKDMAAADLIFAIPQALAKDKERLERVFELCEFASSKEGQYLSMFGIEGRHYNIENGKVVTTDAMAKEGSNFYMFQFFGRNDSEYLPSRFPTKMDYINFAAKQPAIGVVTSAVVAPDGFNVADVQKYVEEEFSKFIYGKRPLSEYDDFVNTLDTKFNLKKYMEKAAQDLKDAGFIK